LDSGFGVPGKKLHLVLNARERFSPIGAGASSLNVLQNALRSRYRGEITVFGSPVEKPFDGVKFQPLYPKWSPFRPFRDRYERLVDAYVSHAQIDRPNLIEVFNRPVMALELARRLPGVPVMARLGNDARKQVGMRTVSRRRELLDRVAEIHCSSHFIRNCFLDGLGGEGSGRVKVIYLGFERPQERPRDKRPTIIFIGRLLPEKGVLPLVEALAQVLPGHPQWSAKLIGARAFKPSESFSPYERSVARAAEGVSQIELTGFVPHEDAMRELQSASIAVMPSLWEEPFGRAAAEALANGCALISSGRGGLREIAEGRGIVLDDVNVGTLSAVMDRLISDEAERTRLQDLAWRDYPFDISDRVEGWDRRRDAMLSGEVKAPI
jgi:glycosyltransferase involved in cell wall biosynthesis